MSVSVSLSIVSVRARGYKTDKFTYREGRAQQGRGKGGEEREALKQGNREQKGGQRRCNGV